MFNEAIVKAQNIPSEAAQANQRLQTLIGWQLYMADLLKAISSASRLIRGSDHGVLTTKSLFTSTIHLMKPGIISEDPLWSPLASYPTPPEHRSSD